MAPPVGLVEAQILQCLIVDGRASFRRIAEVVGVSEQTVARRYRAMSDDGQVRVTVRRSGYVPDRRAWWVRVQCRPDAAASLADALAVRDEVSWIALVSGGSEVACRVVEPVGGGRGGVLELVPRSRAVLSFSAHALLRPFAGGRDEWTMFEPPLGPDQLAHLLAGAPPSAEAAPASPGDDDLLLAHLARDGRATVAALSRELGWPASRVSARMASLLGSEAVHVATEFLPETFGFHAGAFLQLRVPPARTVEVGEALAGHAETGFVAATTGTTNLMAAVTCRTFDDLFRYVTVTLGALPDIQHMELVPYQRRVKLAACRVIDGRLVPPS